MDAVLESLPSSRIWTLALLARVQALGIIARNHDAHQDLALVDALFDGRVVIDESLDLEKPGAAEALDQGAAVGAVVAVVDQSGDAVHIQVERVAEQQHLEQGQNQRHDEAAGIAQRCAGTPSGTWLGCAGRSWIFLLLGFDQPHKNVFHGRLDGFQPPDLRCAAASSTRRMRSVPAAQIVHGDMQSRAEDGHVQHARVALRARAWCPADRKYRAAAACASAARA